ncbi:hypothetical protein S245_055235 [Arachis hypogaea]
MNECKGYPNDRKSTNDYYLFYGANLVVWSSRKQHVVSRSSTEVEYRGIAALISETTWLKNLLNELREDSSKSSYSLLSQSWSHLTYCQPIFHSKFKHFATNFSFVWDHVAKRGVIIKHVPESVQMVDIFTKPVSSKLFTSF